MKLHGSGIYYSRSWLTDPYINTIKLYCIFRTLQLHLTHLVTGYILSLNFCINQHLYIEHKTDAWHTYEIKETVPSAHERHLPQMHGCHHLSGVVWCGTWGILYSRESKVIASFRLPHLVTRSVAGCKICLILSLFIKQC